MEQAEVDRIRRVLQQRSRPPWRLLWRGRPLHLQAGGPSVGPWARRRRQVQAGWRELWTERLRRDLAPIYQFVACRRGRHHDAQVMADDLIGSDLGEAYPEVAICEVFGRAVDWPNGTPTLQGRGPSSLGDPGRLVHHASMRVICRLRRRNLCQDPQAAFFLADLEWLEAPRL